MRLREPAGVVHIGSHPTGTLMRESVVCSLLAYTLSSVCRAGGAGAKDKEIGRLMVCMALPSSVSFKVCHEAFRNYFVNSIEGEWGSAPFLSFFNFLSRWYTFIVIEGTVFLNVVSAHVGIASPKTLSSCIQHFLL